MEQIADRLREARKNAGYDNAQDACEAFGFKYSTYAGHENGSRGIRADSLQRYAKAYGVSVEWLMTGKSPVAKVMKAGPALELAGEAYTPIPVYDIRAAAGAGALVEDGDPSSHQIFRENFLMRITRAPVEQLAVIQVSGDSMWTTLHDGDAVLIDRTITRVVKDGIYVLSLEGELLVKRCQRDLETGEVIVASDNPAYQSFKVSSADRLDVVGRVIWIGRALG